MTKIFIATNGKTDYLVVPHIFVEKLTKYNWVAVNSSSIPEVSEWGIPPRPMKMPEIPVNASEDEMKAIISKTFGEIVAEREDGEADQGWVGLIPEKWEELIDRHRIPDF